MLQAFVDFDSGAEAERAITTKDRQVFAQKFGDRYVRLVQVCHWPSHYKTVAISLAVVYHLKCTLPELHLHPYKSV